MMDVIWMNGVHNYGTRETSEGSDGLSLDVTSNEDGRSSSVRSGSVVSFRGHRKSRFRSKTHSSAPRPSDNFCNSEYPRNIEVPSVRSEDRILQLLAGSGYPMTQINGQRKLGPPPGWTKPAPDPSCEIFVGKLPRDLHEDAIYPVFHQIGEIYEIRLLMDFSGTNRGYCFVMYTKPEYAKQAIEQLNNWEICKGRRIGVVASVNNCRLCIGQLPSGIDTEIIVGKFFDITDEVSSVSVYKNTNGRMRYALVSYCNHRAAAMARRSLLPQRGSIFDKIEITIDWATPGMIPSNVVEEKGTRDESGNLKITRTEIGRRTESRKRERNEFPVTNEWYAKDEKRTGECATNQRGNCHESSKHEVFGQMRRSRSISIQKEVSRHNSNDNNVFQQSENGNVIWSPETRDINGNIDIPEFRRLDAIGKPKNQEENGFLPVNEASIITEQFAFQNPPSFNTFGHYTNPEANILAADFAPTQRYDQSVGYVPPRATNPPIPHFLQSGEKFIDAHCNPGMLRSQEFTDLENRTFELFQNWNFAEKSPRHRENATMLTTSNNPRKTFGPPLTIEKRMNPGQPRHPEKYQAFRQSANTTGSFGISQATIACGLLRDFSKNLAIVDAGMKKNNVCHRGGHPFCQECHDQAKCFVQKFVAQAPNAFVRHGSHVFDNYFRGPNGRADDSTAALCVDSSNEKRHTLLPFCSIVPRSLYATSSFTDYATTPSIGNVTIRPRPILSQNSARLGDPVIRRMKNNLQNRTLMCEQ